MIWPHLIPGPTPTAVRNGRRTFLACLAAAVGVIALVGGGYAAFSIHQITEELAPARLSAEVEGLTDVLPTLRRLEVSYYEADGDCRALLYGRGVFVDSPDFQCKTTTSAADSFDAEATGDLAEIGAALAEAGVDAQVVQGSPTLGGFEFDTFQPSWCLRCPNVNFLYRPKAAPPVDDELDHYIPVAADWYVDVQVPTLLPGFMGGRLPQRTPI